MRVWRQVTSETMAREATASEGERMTWMLASQNLVFVSAGILILVLFLLEVVGSLVAASPSQLLDATLGAEVDLDVGVDDVLDPYHLGKVPWLVRLVVFLSVFSCAGLASQALCTMAFGALAPSWLVGGAVSVLGLWTTRRFSYQFARWMPSSETFAVSGTSFVGAAGRIHGGDARRGYGAQLRVRDPHGRVHYLLVEPEADEVLVEGTPVLVTAQQGARYLVRTHPEPNWVD